MAKKPPKKTKKIQKIKASEPLSIVMIGYGKWGHALHQSFLDAGHHTEILEVHSTSADWRKAFEEPKLAVLCTPFKAIEPSLKNLKAFKTPIGILNCSKGIDRKSLATFSQIVGKYSKAPSATLSGPTFASELSQKKPTACVIASKNKKFSASLAKQLSTPYFRIYSHTDPIGVEACAALKNVLAIAAGCVEGLDLGANARAALITRGSLEMMSVVKSMGGKPATVFGLAGLGDLWLTATGGPSRNRQFGELRAQGMSSKQALEKIGETVEGLYTVEQVHRLMRKKRLDLPICEKVYQLCYRDIKVDKALNDLMTRAVKSEESSSWKLQ